jgi:fatty acid desaturase
MSSRLYIDPRMRRSVKADIRSPSGAPRSEVGGGSLDQELPHGPEMGRLAVNPATAKFEAPWSIGNGDLRRLSMLTLGMGLLHVAFEWALTFAAIFVCERFWHPLLYVFTVVLIGARQYALLILMHAATHYRLLKNRRLNDVVADLFLAWPTLLGLRGFRCNHLAHHRFLNSARDPDLLSKTDDPHFRIPDEKGRLCVAHAQAAFGAGIVDIIRVSRSLSTENSGETRLYKLARLTSYAVSLQPACYSEYSNYSYSIGSCHM